MSLNVLKGNTNMSGSMQYVDIAVVKTLQKEHTRQCSQYTGFPVTYFDTFPFLFLFPNVVTLFKLTEY